MRRNPTHSFETTIDTSLEVTVEGSISPSERQTQWYPGSPGGAEDLTVFLVKTDNKGKEIAKIDITEFIDEDEVNNLRYDFEVDYDDHEAGAREAAEEARYEARRERNM